MYLTNLLKNGGLSASLLLTLITIVTLISDHLFNYNYLTITLIISIISSWLATKWFIPAIDSLKINQIIRNEGPKTHYKKSGTPTMGGLVIITVGVIITNLINIYSFNDKKVIGLSLLALAFMFIGALDDWKSLTQKTNSGLSAKAKILLQSIAAIFFLAWTSVEGLINPIIEFPFHFSLNVGILIIPIAIFVFIAESNSTNLADGLDGLASGCGALIFMGFTIELILRNSQENYALASFSIVMCGCWLGFLQHNKNPAKIFMGDTGSLAIGGSLTGLALLSNNLWSLLIMGGVFLAESLSVIIQVWFFKWTKKHTGEGQKIFLMTPLHHHYEIAGVHENIIVISFWGTTILLIIITLLMNKNF